MYNHRYQIDKILWKYLESPKLVSLQSLEKYKLEKFTKVENLKYFIKREVEKSQGIVRNKCINSRLL